MTVTLRGCKVCQPELAEAEETLHDNHYRAHLNWRAEVFLNGERIMDPYEIVTGPGGWAKRVDTVDGKPQRCPCGGGSFAALLDVDDGYTVIDPPWIVAPMNERELGQCAEQGIDPGETPTIHRYARASETAAA